MLCEETSSSSREWRPLPRLPSFLLESGPVTSLRLSVRLDPGQHVHEDTFADQIMPCRHTRPIVADDRLLWARYSRPLTQSSRFSASWGLAVSDNLTLPYTSSERHAE